MVIGCTIFPHKRLHKVAWVSVEHTQKNQVDHICINEEFRGTVEDVRTRRGAHIASDHHLVVAKMKLKLKKCWATDGKSLQRFNTASLQDSSKLNEFKTTLDNRFQALQDLLKETMMEDNWKEIEEALTSAYQRIQKRKNEKTAINNSRTGAVKIKAQADNTEVNNQVKQIIRADRQKCVEDLATTERRAAREGNMKQLRDTTKKLAGNYSKSERPVEDEGDKPITVIREQGKGWKEHYKEFLNRPDPPDIAAADKSFPIAGYPPTIEEIRIAGHQTHQDWESCQYTSRSTEVRNRRRFDRKNKCRGTGKKDASSRYQRQKSEQM
ncbi:unnamed protein product [Schistosoma curassoni]|uniref:Reverse transcriptase domain-containing protein n=1 Tax=Schistosoma curassoni TaxID=6186 RepID=A0A183JTV8_9TREM|nr:unnamed protein product [Schistosoma curassoni]